MIKYFPYLFILLIGCSAEGNQLALENNSPLVKSRAVHQVITTVQFIEPQVLAERNIKPGQNSAQALEEQKRSLTFKLNLKTENPEQGDIMRHGVYTPEQFKEQAFDLNFNWESMVEITCGGQSYRPVLSTLENTYGLTRDRNIMLVFVPEADNDNNFYGSEEIQFTFKDDYFGTGTQHFTFKRADLIGSTNSNKG